jgi:hypothetical protein
MVVVGAHRRDRAELRDRAGRDVFRLHPRPARGYAAALARDAVDWRHIDIWQGDERFSYGRSLA